MSMAPRPAKWKGARRAARDTRRSMHRVIDLALEPHERLAARRALLRHLALLGPACACSRTGPTTSGMTSPARRTITVSPTRTSLRAISSSLWSVACDTVDAADAHRLEHGERRGGAGAADVDVDVVEQRRRRSSGGNL